MIRKQTVQSVRAVVNQTLTECADILRPTGAVDALGAPTHAMETASEGVKCRIIRAGSQSVDMATGEGLVEQIKDRYRAILPYGTVLGVDYQIVIGERTYSVIAIDDDLTDAAFVGAVVLRLR